MLAATRIGVVLAESGIGVARSLSTARPLRKDSNWGPDGAFHAPYQNVPHPEAAAEFMACHGLQKALEHLDTSLNTQRIYSSTHVKAFQECIHQAGALDFTCELGSDVVPIRPGDVMVCDLKVDDLYVGAQGCSPEESMVVVLRQDNPYGVNTGIMIYMDLRSGVEPLEAAFQSLNDNEVRAHLVASGHRSTHLLHEAAGVLCKMPPNVWIGPSNVSLAPEEFSVFMSLANGGVTIDNGSGDLSYGATVLPG